jgi:PIN domain nuclease of toxin-antitoxin system
MKPEMLDTHLLIWYLTGNKWLNRRICYDIDYYQRSFCVSVEALKEIVMLRARNKIDAHLTLVYVLRILEERAISIIYVELSHLMQLEGLPFLIDPATGDYHRDPVDRMMISQAISMGYALISADHMFPYYEEHGLKVIVN